MQEPMKTLMKSSSGTPVPEEEPAAALDLPQITGDEAVQAQGDCCF